MRLKIGSIEDIEDDSWTMRSIEMSADGRMRKTTVMKSSLEDGFPWSRVRRLEKKG